MLEGKFMLFKGASIKGTVHEGTRIAHFKENIVDIALLTLY